eukprot:857257-Rhodomonas_salina.1
MPMTAPPSSPVRGKCCSRTCCPTNSASPGGRREEGGERLREEGEGEGRRGKEREGEGEGEG